MSKRTASKRRLLVLGAYSVPLQEKVKPKPILQADPRASAADLSRRKTVLLSVRTLSSIVAFAITYMEFGLVPALAAFAISFAALKSIGRSHQAAIAATFSKDYPTVLLAMASSIKVGLTPELALERSTRLLPRNNLVRKEVDSLIASMRSGTPAAGAINSFGKSIDLPDLELFRSAFLLVVENGGRFAPALQRLAEVTRDRTALINSARVSTAIMRMTANILLALTPLVMLVVSSTIPGFWHTLSQNPVANRIAALGGTLILLGYLSLRRMSGFRP